ncbi:hypothetical protein [Alkalinema pantanalense]|uniref:hypothetical protein n=1 Tax=Alkalinema pantanalense TaxID=1620705 RepID=UPI003D6F8E41
MDDTCLAVGREYDRLVPYINRETQQKLQASSRDRPLRVILSFGKHRGRDCECCNLAHKVRVYDSTQRESGFWWENLGILEA